MSTDGSIRTVEAKAFFVRETEAFAAETSAVRLYDTKVNPATIRHSTEALTGAPATIETKCKFQLRGDRHHERC
ncbi:MAG: hypothetical protein ISN28_11750 [Ectothiorhodospiraceae bacterium AqS1]|nr:hypothetical protein [Ectothiorhodospiraceae bacterium AqS1]